MWFGTGAPTAAAATAHLHGLWFAAAGFGMSFEGVVGGILGLGGFLAVGLARGTAVTAADRLSGRGFFHFVQGRQMLRQCCGPSTGWETEGPAAGISGHPRGGRLGREIHSLGGL